MESCSSSSGPYTASSLKSLLHPPITAQQSGSWTANCWYQTECIDQRMHWTDRCTYIDMHVCTWGVIFVSHRVSSVSISVTLPCSTLLCISVLYHFFSLCCFLLFLYSSLFFSHCLSLRSISSFYYFHGLMPYLQSSYLKFNSLMPHFHRFYNVRPAY